MDTLLEISSLQEYECIPNTTVLIYYKRCSLIRYIRIVTKTSKLATPMVVTTLYS